MMPNMRKWVLAAFGFAVLGSNHCDAQLAVVAFKGDALPTGNGDFLDLYPPRIADSGSLLFQSGVTGLYLVSNGIVQEVARTSQPAPDLNGSFGVFAGHADFVAPYSLVMGSSDHVLFMSILTGTLGGGNDDTGIFLFNGTNVLQIAREGQSIPVLQGAFGDVAGARLRINASGEIVGFAGVRSNNVTRDTIFRYKEGSFTRLAAVGDAMPDGNGTISTLWPPAMNNVGIVVMAAWISGSSNFSSRAILRVHAGNLSLIARTGQTVPNGNGKISFFMNAAYGFPPTLNDQGHSAFVATLDETTGGATDNQAIYVASENGLTEVIRKGDSIPGNSGRFATFQNYVAFNNQGQLVFGSELSGTPEGAADNAAIFSAKGGFVKQIARKGQTIPSGNGKFGSFYYPALNDKGEIAFYASLTETSGGNSDNVGIFFVDTAGLIHTVAREGQSVEGISLIGIEPDHFLALPDPSGAAGLNNNGDIAFSGTANGKGKSIYVWSRSQTDPPQVTGNDVRIPFTVVAGTTNYLQVSSGMNGVENGFSDLSGPIIISDKWGILKTNFVHVGGATEQSRFYRIRSPQ